jgi:hypothetical protein
MRQHPERPEKAVLEAARFGGRPLNREFER